MMASLDPLGKLDRQRRIDAVQTAFARFRPDRAKVARIGNWPRPYCQGELSDCRVFGTDTNGCGGAKAQPLVLWEGRRRKAMDLVIEAASGYAMQAGWTLVPFHCGDRDCVNPHHWRVLRAPDGSNSQPALAGFVAILPGQLQDIIGLMNAAGWDAGTPPHVIHRSLPDQMFDLILAAQDVLKFGTEQNQEQVIAQVLEKKFEREMLESEVFTDGAWRKKGAPLAGNIT